MTYSLTIARDTPTELGILAAGLTVQVVPNQGHTAWVVEMALPRAAGLSHPLELPKAAVFPGALRKLTSLDRARCAHHDYTFGRGFLGMSHLSTIRWLMEGYGVTARQLERWGFRNVKSEAVAA